MFSKNFQYICRLIAAAVFIFVTLWLPLALFGVDKVVTTIVSLTATIAAVLNSAYHSKEHKRGGNIVPSYGLSPEPVKIQMFHHESLSVQVDLTVDFPANSTVQEATPLSLYFDLVTPPDTQPQADNERPFYFRLHTSVSGQNFTFDKKSDSLMLGYGSSLVEIVFKVTPTELGDQSLGIEIFQNARRIRYEEVVTTVAKDKHDEARHDSALTIIYENSLNKILPRAKFRLKDPRQYLIHVARHNTQGDTLCFTVHTDRGQTEKATKTIGSETEVLESLQIYLNTFKEILFSGADSPASFQNELANFTGIGKELFAQCIPDSLQELIRDWPSESCVGISTEETWFPWELFHDGSNFLGLRFTLYRLPKRNYDFDTAISKMKTQAEGKEKSSLRVHEILNIVGGDIGKVAEEKLLSLFKFVKGPATKVDRAKCLEIHQLVHRVENKDLIHFTCHGRGAKGKLPYLQTATSDGTQKNLLLTSVANLKLKTGCLVFINACDTETPHLLFKEFVSFGWKFYENGAGMCIGTLMSVPENGAIRFSEQFYRHLLEEGETLATSMAETRRELFKEGTIFPIFYCLYGNPNIELAIPDANAISPTSASGAEKGD